MNKETTDGVLIKGADGATYFIPNSALSKFAIPGKLSPEESLTENAPQLEAFAVRGEATEADELTSFIILGAEGDDDADDSSEILGVEGEPGGDDE